MLTVMLVFTTRTVYDDVTFPHAWYAGAIVAMEAVRITLKRRAATPIRVRWPGTAAPIGVGWPRTAAIYRWKGTRIERLSYDAAVDVVVAVFDVVVAAVVVDVVVVVVVDFVVFVVFV